MDSGTFAASGAGAGTGTNLSSIPVPLGASAGRRRPTTSGMRTLFSLVLAAAALALPQGAVAADRDHDRLPDGWERKHGLSTAKSGAHADQDGDRVDNLNELRQGTRPRDRDSDDDGLSDGREDRDRDGLSNAGEDLTGNDPRLRDTDRDGVRDGKEAVGVVSYFEESVVGIELPGGDTVYALVTGGTEVECVTESSLEAGYAGSPHRGKRGRRGRRGKRGRRGRRSARSAVVSPERGMDEGDEEDDLGLDEDEGDDDLLEDEDEEGDDEDGDDEDGGGGEDEDDDLDEDEGDEPGSCSADVLEPGVAVHDAELHLAGEGLVLDYIVVLR